MVMYPDFNVGYMEGPASKQCKVALVTDNDLDCMYKRHSKGGLITLWCDGKLNDKKKRSRNEGDGGRREEREEEVDSIYKELLERHGSTGNYAFVVTNDCIWIIYDAPPCIPALGHGNHPRSNVKSHYVML